jgi:CBS domain-containing protein
VDGAGELVGIVSERDLMRRAESGTQHHRSWWLELLTEKNTLAREFIKENSRKITDVMKRNVITAGPGATLGEIANILEKNSVKRVPIVENGAVLGIVSRANLMQALATLGKAIPAQGKPDDATVRERVLARLKGESWRPTLINVIVHEGEVDLWGIAESTAQKEAARVAAEVTPGVVAVNDNVLVRPMTYGE